MNNIPHACVEFMYALVGGIVYGLRMGNASAWMRVSGMVSGTLVGTFIGPGIAVHYSVTDPSVAAAIITSTGIFGATIVESLLFVLKDKDIWRRFFKQGDSNE